MEIHPDPITLVRLGPSRYHEALDRDRAVSSTINLKQQCEGTLEADGYFLVAAATV